MYYYYSPSACQTRLCWRPQYRSFDTPLRLPSPVFSALWNPPHPSRKAALFRDASLSSPMQALAVALPDAEFQCRSRLLEWFQVQGLGFRIWCWNLAVDLDVRWWTTVFCFWGLGCIYLTALILPHNSEWKTIKTIQLPISLPSRESWDGACALLDLPPQQGGAAKP